MVVTTGRVLSSRRVPSVGLPAGMSAFGSGGVPLHILTSPALAESAALISRDGIPVLILREGLVSPGDLTTLRAVCSCIEATLSPVLSDEVLVEAH